MAQRLVTGYTTPGATVTVYWAGTTTKPTINVSDGGTAASNPITADSNNGFYAFWISDGHYTVVNGIATGTDRDLRVKTTAGTAGAPGPSDIKLLPYLGSTETDLEGLVEKLLAGTLSLSGLTSTGGVSATTIAGSGALTVTGAALNQATANGANLAITSASEEITLSTSGTTTDSTANLLPAGSIILGVVARVTTTITTATDWSLGDGTTAARFAAANSTLTAGTTSIGLAHWSGAISTLAAGPSQAAAAKLRITTTGTPGAGKIRVTVFALTHTAPTS